MTDQDLTHQIAERVHDAAARRAPLRPVGGDTKRFYGRAVAGEVLELRDHAGVVNYDPAELVLTARCGTRLTEIDELLAAHGQRLGFDPPRHGAAATIGGAIAAGLAGPSRPRHGAVRDHVQGVRVLTGDGRALRFGGEVLKNVAGYDIARLMAGSLGILGVLLEVSLRVLPRPTAALTLVYELAADAAHDRLRGWSAAALPLTASTWIAGALYACFEGTEATLSAVGRGQGGEVLADATSFWTSIRDHTHPFFTGSVRLWRLHLPGGSLLPIADDAVLIEWQGGQCWYRDREDPGPRSIATAAGGSATLFRGATGDEEVFQTLAPALLRIHRSLKQAFDPAGILNPGRMYAGL